MQWNYCMTKTMNLKKYSSAQLTKMVWMTSVNHLVDEIIETKKLSDRTVAELLLKNKATYYVNNAKNVNWRKFSSKKLMEIAKVNTDVLQEALKIKKLTKQHICILADQYAKSKAVYIDWIIESKKLSGTKMLQIIKTKKRSDLINKALETGLFTKNQENLARKLFTVVKIKANAEEKIRQSSSNYTGGSHHC